MPPEEIAEAMAKKEREAAERPVVNPPKPDILGLPVISGGYFRLPLNHHLDRATADTIYKHRVFRSTTSRAMEECAVPLAKVLILDASYFYIDLYILFSNQTSNFQFLQVLVSIIH